MRLIIILLFKVLCLNITYSQEVISGKIVDENNDPLVGINIFFEEDKLIGTTSDINGNYSLELNKDYPVTIVISGISYETQNIIIRSERDLVKNIILLESVLLGEEVVVSASLFEQNILTAPVSIEKLDIIDIEQSSAANFYDELYKIKGVDMIVQSGKPACLDD